MNFAELRALSGTSWFWSAIWFSEVKVFRSTWFSEVHGPPKYMVLRSTWFSEVHGSPKFSKVHDSLKFLVQNAMAL